MIELVDTIKSDLKDGSIRRVVSLTKEEIDSFPVCPITLALSNRFPKMQFEINDFYIKVEYANDFMVVTTRTFLPIIAQEAILKFNNHGVIEPLRFYIKLPIRFTRLLPEEVLK